MSDEQFDELLRMAAREVFDEEIAALSCEKHHAHYKPAAHHEREIAAILGHRRWLRLLAPLKVAAVLLLFAAVGAVFAGADARAAVWSQIVQWNSQFVRFAFYQDSERDPDLETDHAAWKPTYIPEGFWLADVMYLGASTLHFFESDSDDILLSASAARGASTAVGQTRTTHSVIEVDGFTYHVFTPIDNETNATVVWERGGVAFLLIGSVHPDVLLTMALSVEYTRQ